MRYYFETNALYNLKKIPQTIITQGFTSVFSIVEIIGGMTAQDYLKRRAVLKNVKESKLIIDSAFPQEVIMNSFDAFDEDELHDERIGWLESAMQQAIGTKSYEDFSTMKMKGSDYTFDFFTHMDVSLSSGFVAATLFGNTIIKKGVNETIEIGSKKYQVNSLKDLEIVFREEIKVNKSITLLALASMMSKAPGNSYSEEEIYSSYNGLVDIYVESFSKYCIDKIVNSDSPSRNDFQDLTHLLYLRNDMHRKIVTEDKIYKKYLPGACVSVNDLPFH